MYLYSDKLVNQQVVTNCLYFLAQLYTGKNVSATSLKFETKLLCCGPSRKLKKMTKLNSGIPKIGIHLNTGLFSVPEFKL